MFSLPKPDRRTDISIYRVASLGTKNLLFQATEETGGNVLLVAHAGSLDTCTRQLVGKDPRPVNALMSIVRKVGLA